MAFFLTPRFAPAYAPQYNPCSRNLFGPSYRRVSRVSHPAIPSFSSFLGQVDELLTELDHGTCQQTRQRQPHQRTIRAHFNVHQNEGGYQIDGEIPGFQQENLAIEVTDDHTVKVVGNTELRGDESPLTPPQPVKELIESGDDINVMEGAKLHEHEPKFSDAASTSHNDTESQKSHHATVEDDFEDLGAETASTLSTDSQEAPELKGKEKATEEPRTTEVTSQPQPASPAKSQQPKTEDRFAGAFERTFRFPDKIDASSIQASLRNGLLSISVPKAKAPEIKRILIQ